MSNAHRERRLDGTGARSGQLPAMPKRVTAADAWCPVDRGVADADGAPVARRRARQLPPAVRAVCRSASAPIRACTPTTCIWNCWSAGDSWPGRRSSGCSLAPACAAPRAASISGRATTSDHRCRRSRRASSAIALHGLVDLVPRFTATYAVMASSIGLLVWPGGRMAHGRMRIAFDGTTLRPGRTGVGYYTEHLLRHVVDEGRQHEVMVVSNRPIDLARPLPARVAYTRHAGGRRGSSGCTPGAPAAATPQARCRALHQRHGAALVAGADRRDDSRHEPDALPAATTRRGACCSTVRSWISRRGAPTPSSRCRTAPSATSLRHYGLADDRVHVVTRSRGAGVPPHHATWRGSTPSASATDWPIASCCTSARSSRERICGCCWRRLRCAAGAPSFRIKLVCVGPYGWLCRDIEDLVEQPRHRAPRAASPATCRSTDLPAIYNLAEMVAFPSIYEGFGLPVIEAMACGTPVITGRVAALVEVGGEAIEQLDYRVRRPRRREDAVPARPRQGGGPAGVGCRPPAWPRRRRGPPSRAGRVAPRRRAGRCLQRRVGEAGPAHANGVGAGADARLLLRADPRRVAVTRTVSRPGRDAPRAPRRLRVPPVLRRLPHPARRPPPGRRGRLRRHGAAPPPPPGARCRPGGRAS